MISDAEAAEKIPFDLASFDAVIFSDAAIRRGTPRKVQILAGVVVVLAHVGFWWILQWISRPDVPQTVDDDALLVSFITRALSPEKAPPVPTRAATAHALIAQPRTTAERAVAQPSVQASAHPPVTRGDASASQLYNDDGTVRIPADVLADIGKLRGDERVFDFQQPGLERAAKLFQQQSPLEYRAIRFDKDWRPNQDLLTEMLTKAVEASTKEVRIPIPGDPRHHVVCRISLLAMGGGCGVQRNGADGDVLPGHDDPATLSAEEDKACQAWWEKIISAKSQDEWRETRKLYEQECRKPLAREPVMP